LRDLFVTGAGPDSGGSNQGSTRRHCPATNTGQWLWVKAEIEASSCSMTRGNASTRGLTRLIEDEARFRGAVHGHDIAGHGGEERSAAERVNGGLKDDFGGRYVRVRGHTKVFCHLMFGVLALAIDHLMRLIT
jgi:hypothetical protein